MTLDRNRPPRRIFACRQCGYRLRFGAERCGDCYAPTPLFNRRPFWLLLVLALLAGAAAAAALLALAAAGALA